MFCRTFCHLHLPVEEHSCTFDYQEEGRRRIAAQNPVVKGEKVRKI